MEKKLAVYQQTKQALKAPQTGGLDEAELKEILGF